MSGKRSAKVIHHDFGNPSAKQNTPSIRRRFAYAFVLVLLAIIGVSAFLIADNISLDSLSRRFTYIGLGKDDTGIASEISFVAHSRNTFAEFDDGIAIATVGGVELYSMNGELLYSESLVLSQPVLKTGKNTAMVYDLGGTTLLAFNSSGKVAQLDMDAPILDASINDKGWVALTTQESGYRALVTVYDDTFSERYRFHSASKYISLACVSPDCQSVTAAALSQGDSRFMTELVTYRLDSEELYSSFVIADQLVLSLSYTSDDTMCAVCDDEILFISSDGSSCSFSYEGSFLRDVSISDSGFVAMALSKYQAGTKCRVVTVSQDGSLLGSIDYNEELLSLTTAGKNVSVLTSGQANIYDKSMKPTTSISDLAGIRNAIIRKDGSAYLIYTDRVSFYIPS